MKPRTMIVLVLLLTVGGGVLMATAMRWAVQRDRAMRVAAATAATMDTVALLRDSLATVNAARDSATARHAARFDSLATLAQRRAGSAWRLAQRVDSLQAMADSVVRMPVDSLPAPVLADLLARLGDAATVTIDTLEAAVAACELGVVECAAMRDSLASRIRADSVLLASQHRALTLADSAVSELQALAFPSFSAQLFRFGAADVLKFGAGVGVGWGLKSLTGGNGTTVVCESPKPLVSFQVPIP